MWILTKLSQISPQCSNCCQSNILIDAAGHARVAGLDLIVASSNVGPTPSTTRGPVWLAAPEVLGTGTGVSKEADIFSFAMTVVEVHTRSIISTSRVIHHY